MALVHLRKDFVVGTMYLISVMISIGNWDHILLVLLTLAHRKKKNMQKKSNKKKHKTFKILRFDHTLANAFGAFLFIEGSSPTQAGDKALFESNLFFPTPSYGICLDFWYHMWGNGIGTLNG